MTIKSGRGSDKATAELSRQEIVDLSRETTLYEWTAQSTMKPLVVDHAKGIYFWDADGKRYMDFNSQLMCVNIGYGDQRVIDAIKDQLERVCYVAPTTSTTAVRAELGRLLQEITPGNLTKAFFAQATPENKLKLIRENQAGGKLVAVTTTGTNSACGPGVTAGAPDATACVGVDGRGPVGWVLPQFAHPSVRSTELPSATAQRARVRQSSPFHTPVLIPSSALSEHHRYPIPCCIPGAKDTIASSLPDLHGDS